MLSDEEKKAIEGLFHLAHINTYLDLEKEDVVKISRTLIDQWRDKTEILLNLIEKQQKEIEELKTTKKELTERVLRLESDKFWENVVSKDKIKAKIEEYKKQQKEEPDAFLCIKALSSLLEKEQLW